MRWVSSREVKRDDDDGEDGSVLILTAAALMGLIVFLGLILDYGHSAQRHRLAQNAADAAALGASYEIYAGQSEATATTVAQSVVAKQGFPSTDLTLSYLDSSGNVTAIASNVAKVRTWVQDTSPTILLNIVGVRTTTVYGNAAASQRVAPPSCALCVLDPHLQDSLYQQGSGTTTINGGAVVIDSDNTEAAYLQGSTYLTSADLQASYIGIVGNYRTQGPATFTPTPTTGIQPVPDPLASVPAPTCSAGNPSNIGDYSGSGTILPGTYNSISVSGRATLTLSPGTYCITGGAFGGGTGQFVGNGVTLYFTCGTYLAPAACTAGQVGGSMQLTGTPNYTLSAPTTGTYKGLSFFYDRNNAASFGLKGDAGDSLIGTIYAKSAAVTLIGNAAMNKFDSLVICDTYTLQGNAGVTDDYVATDNYEPPAPPTLSE